jgi:hypothetical protein
MDSITQLNLKSVPLTAVLPGCSPSRALSPVSSSAAKSAPGMQPDTFIVKPVLAERWKQSDDTISVYEATVARLSDWRKSL